MKLSAATNTFLRWNRKIYKLLDKKTALEEELQCVNAEIENVNRDISHCTAMCEKTRQRMIADQAAVKG